MDLVAFHHVTSTACLMLSNRRHDKKTTAVVLKTEQDEVSPRESELSDATAQVIT